MKSSARVSGEPAKKAPLRRGFEVPSSSLRTTRWFAVSSCGARLSDSNESAQRTGTSRHHEHLNFAAETCGADAPASIVRPACSSTRHIVPDSYNKLGAAVTRARVDPQISLWYVLSASRSFCASLPRSPTRQKSETVVRTVFSSANCTHSKGKYHVAICRQSRGNYAPPWGELLTAALQRDRRTAKRTPLPSGRLAADASPPWNSAISRTI